MPCAKRSGIEHFQGVSVQPMIKLEGYEIIIGRQHRSAVRAGAAVRIGRPTGRSVQGSLAGAAAVEFDAGPPHDGADHDLQSPQGRARPQAGRSGRAGAGDGALQRTRRGAALDQRDRHQSDARHPRSDHRPRRARRGAWQGRDQRSVAPAGDSALSVEVRQAVDDQARAKRSASAPFVPKTSRCW